MTDDLTTLASAYLDGETTPDERVQVEASAELLAEVERLRRVRAVLHGADDLDDELTAPISVRERHLAAALDAYDRLPASELTGDATPQGVDAAAAAGTASMTAPTSLADRRARRFSSKVLTAAAAVVIIAGAGLVVRSAITSNDDGDVDVAEQSDAAGDAEDLTASAELETTPLDAAEETFSDDAAADEEVPTFDPPAAEAADEASEGEAVQGGPEQARPDDEGLEVLSSDEELAEFANDLVVAKQAEEERAAAEAAAEADVAPADAPADADVGAPAPAETIEPAAPLCDVVDEIVGFALWDTDGLFDEAVVVGIDNAAQEAVAYRAEDCTVVARTALLDL